LNSENAQPRHGLSPALILGGLIVLAIALRFWRLGDWNFQSTEMFTLRDSFTPQFRNPRPLGYLLTYYLVKPFLPLNEFGLRLLPAIFGVLTIPALYFVSRRLVGARAALFGALLLTFSHLHVNYSQLARYWSLVILLSAIYPYALYIGVRDRSRGALALGVVTGVLAALAHPVAILLLMGPAVLLAFQVRRLDLRRLWGQTSVRWAAMLLAVAAGLIAWRFLPLLQGWISQHDESPGGGEFLHPTFRQGVKQIYYLLGLSEGLTPPVALTGVMGIYLLWRARDKSLAVFLASLALFPIVFLTLISVRTPVSQYYLVPTLPVFFLGAGVFLDHLFKLDWGLRPRWLLPTAIVLLVLTAGWPSLASEYLNGRRYDFRAMAQWLQPRMAPGDIVFSDQPRVLTHYLTGTKVQHLEPDTLPLQESLHAVREIGPGGGLWIVAPTMGHAFRTDLKSGGLIDWIYNNCQLKYLTGKGRVDFRQQYLQIHRCPPANVAFPRPIASP